MPEWPSFQEVPLHDDIAKGLVMLLVANHNLQVCCGTSVCASIAHQATLCSISTLIHDMTTVSASCNTHRLEQHSTAEQAWGSE